MLSKILTVSGQWPRRHSRHSHQTAECADPGPHAGLTTGQGLILNNKTEELLLVRTARSTII